MKITTVAKRLPALLVVATAALSTPRAHATNSPIELKRVLESLMAWLPGEFDNAPQVFFETETKTPKDLLHARNYRAFHRIKAEGLGENVLIGELRAGGKQASRSPAEIRVWTLSIDDTRKVVRMSPRRFKTAEEEKRWAGVVRDPLALAGATLSASDLIAGDGVAGCEILWRLRGQQLTGKSEKDGCKGRLQNGTTFDFTWEWTLNDEELWIALAGRDASGAIVFGPQDGTEFRLGKARDFECLFSHRPKTGEPVVLNGARMHDRGDIFVWEPKLSPARKFYYELIRGMWPSNSGKNFDDLLRIYMYEGDPDGPPEKNTFLGLGWASASSDRASFSSANYSGRCKLYDPSMPLPAQP